MSSSSEDDDPNVNIIPMDNFFSDGDVNTWPSGGHYVERPDIRWRELLAENWLKEMGTYEEGELTTGFIFTFCLACWLCCIALFRASRLLSDCIRHSIQLSFTSPLFYALYLPIPSFLLCFYPSYLCSRANRVYIRCRSYH